MRSSLPPTPIVIKRGIYWRTPDGSGDCFNGQMRHVAVGETLMISDRTARKYVGKVLPPDLTREKREFEDHTRPDVEKFEEWCRRATAGSRPDPWPGWTPPQRSTKSGAPSKGE